MIAAVGLSGGVDSSVAAYLLKKKGWQVIGIKMNLFSSSDDTSSKDAKKVADYLEIPYYEIDMEMDYSKIVISYIQDEYSKGRTPNPCVVCNQNLKFGSFLDKANESGINFDFFCTGHYAIIEKDIKTNRYNLFKGLHAEKDQAYFLSMLTQNQLKKIHFPLGKMTKQEVRKIADEAGLFTSNKKESQDLCSGDYRKYITNSNGSGNFVDKNGKILGTHKGIENYTIGQRRGLDISSSTLPYYVTAIDPQTNIVHLGFNDDLIATKMLIDQPNWISINEPVLPMEVTAKIRYRDNGSAATITEKLDQNKYLVEFQESRRAITPGQIAVFYSGDKVIGGSYIDHAIK